MPAPSRWMIRCSLLYLLAGFIIGALMLIAKAYPAYSQFWAFLPVHIEILIFGFIIQFTMGTAYWILPRLLKSKPRGSGYLARLMVICLNFGIGFIIIDSLAWTEVPLRLAGRTLEVLAVVIFIALHWDRVVTYRK